MSQMRGGPQPRRPPPLSMRTAPRIPLGRGLRHTSAPHWAGCCAGRDWPACWRTAAAAAPAAAVMHTAGQAGAADGPAEAVPRGFGVAPSRVSKRNSQRREPAVWRDRSHRKKNLPVLFTNRVFHSYVYPGALFGLEFVPPGPQLGRFRLECTNGVVACLNGRAAPQVQGQLGWLDLWSARLMSAAGPWARCLCMPCSCPAARIARFAVTQPSSWAAAIQTELQQIRVPDPSCCSIAPSAPRTVTHRWLQYAKNVICSHSFAQFQAVAQNTDSLLQHLHWQPTPHLHPVVYGQQTCPLRARAGVLPDADIMTSRMGVLLDTVMLTL